MVLKRFLTYAWQAGNEHRLHSPFLYDFYLKVVKDTERPVALPEIQQLRKSLKNTHQTIEVTDFGAGAKRNNGKLRKISFIARTSEKPLKWQLMLYRILKHYYRNATVVDLGTSLGLTTAFMAFGGASNQIYTFEGCSNIGDWAAKTFRTLKLSNVQQIIGNIDETLPDFLETVPSVDMAFFDANHRYEPTMRYFEWCLTKANENSVFIFDDIYWSDEMAAAWEAIKSHPEVTLSVDFFQLGIVFFRKKQPKQHFVLRP